MAPKRRMPTVDHNPVSINSFWRSALRHLEHYFRGPLGGPWSHDGEGTYITSNWLQQIISSWVTCLTAMWLAAAASEQSQGQPCELTYLPVSQVAGDLSSRQLAHVGVCHHWELIAFYLLLWELALWELWDLHCPPVAFDRCPPAWTLVHTGTWTIRTVPW